MARRFADELFSGSAGKSAWLGFLRRRDVGSTSPAKRLVSAPAIATQSFFAEAVHSSEASIYADAWADLAARAASANVFLLPAFALTAIRHLPATDRPALVLVWDDRARQKLVGLCPLHLEPSKARVATSWIHPDAPFGGPLLDRECSAGAMAAMLDLIGAKWPRMCGLVLSGARRDAALHHPVAQAPFDVIDGSIREFVAYEASRQSAREGASMADRFDASRIATAESHDDVRTDLESFLTLEASQSGGGRPALIDQAGFSAFARSMTRQLSRSSHCSIRRIMRGSTPIASAILLHAQDTTFLWKLAAVRDPDAKHDIQRFLSHMVLGEARRGRTTIPCQPLPFGNPPDLVPTRMSCADLIATLPGREPAAVANALRRERRRRFAQAFGRHLVSIAGNAARS